MSSAAHELEAVVLEVRMIVARLPGLLPSCPERRFNEMFGLLCQFAFREGHVNVLATPREAGELLGLWVCDLKGSYRAEILSQGKVDGPSPRWREALDRVPGWEWPSVDP